MSFTELHRSDLHRKHCADSDEIAEKCVDFGGLSLGFSLIFLCVFIGGVYFIFGFGGEIEVFAGVCVGGLVPWWRE